jgi:nucleoside-diphosphate-sugar epimerase
MSNVRVLVTGAAGRVGRLLLQSLKDRYFVRATDVVPVEGDFEFVRADITDFESIRKAVEGVNIVAHLAAIIPPLSERDREKTMRVNVEGTENLLKSIEGKEQNIHFIFSSSVAVYGIAENDGSPITVDHRISPTDIYSESKIISEDLIRKSKVAYTILRISGIYAPDRIELPETLQFQREQKVEFVYLDDVATALKASIERYEARYKIFNIAGGASWRMTGREFINRMYGALDLEVEPNFSSVRTYFSWYDTKVSNGVLGYQQNSFNDFIENLREMGKKLGFL